MHNSALAAAVAAVALLAAQASAQERYTYLHHSNPTNVFWQAVKKGMDEACGQVGADCQMIFLQQDGNFQEQLNNLEAAIAQKPDGIIMTFAGGEIFDEALDRARRPASRCWPAMSTTPRRRTACPSLARTSSRRATISPPG